MAINRLIRIQESFSAVCITRIDILLHSLSNKQPLKPSEVCFDVETQAIILPEKQHEGY